MARIAPAALTGGDQFTRTQVAQATTGQTDWIAVPAWAVDVLIDYNLTAVAGTTPLVDVTVVKTDSTTNDDTTGIVNLVGHAAFTQITGAARLLIQVGPGITGIADDTATAATGTSNVALNAVLPPLIGVKILQDRTSADETYSYTLSVTFRGRK